MGFVFFLSYIDYFITWINNFKDEKYLQSHAEWMTAIGSSFSVKLDGMGQLLCLLTAVAFPCYFYCYLENSL